MTNLSRREYWEQQLASCQAHTSSCASRAWWMSRAYARIYRFMLAQYGSHEALPERAPENCDALPSSIESDIPPAGVHGLGEIRKTLKHIHQFAPQTPQGELATGMTPHAWITLAYASNQLDLRRCRRALSLDGFDCRTLHHADRSVLQVRVRDFDKAYAWLAERRERFRPARRSLQNGWVIYAGCLLLSIPAVMSVVVCLQSPQWPQAIPVAIINAGLALLSLTVMVLLITRSYARRH